MEEDDDDLYGENGTTEQPTEPINNGEAEVSDDAMDEGGDDSDSDDSVRSLNLEAEEQIANMFY